MSRWIVTLTLCYALDFYVPPQYCALRDYHHLSKFLLIRSLLYTICINRTVYQMDSHMEQASVPHWAARVEAIEGLLELLTVSGAVGSGREGGAEGGRHILESRSASKRLEAMVGERLKDAHFRVLTSTLRLLGGLVEAHPAPMAGQAFSLLPSVRNLICPICFEKSPFFSPTSLPTSPSPASPFISVLFFYFP